MGVEVYTWEDVCKMMDCSKSKAYNMMRAINLKNAKEKNLNIKDMRCGRVSKALFDEIHNIKKVD